MSLIVAILVFGLIVLIHEFGHFIVAKRCGIGVLEFAIGMGPSIWSTVRGETRYSLKIIPFGGYCMMQDEDKEAVDEKSFNSKSVWTRIAVIAAGPIFNFLLALVLGLVIVTAVGYDSPQLIDVQDGFPAQEQGMQAGDIITKLGEDFVGNYTQLAQVLRKYEAGDSTTVTVLRNGHTVELTITFDEKQNTTVSNPQEEIPDEGSSYEEWYDYFEKYFGGR